MSGLGQAVRGADLRAAAFDAWPEAALVLDSQGGLVALNEAAEDLFPCGS